MPFSFYNIKKLRLQSTIKVQIINLCVEVQSKLLPSVQEPVFQHVHWEPCCQRNHGHVVHKSSLAVQNSKWGNQFTVHIKSVR